MTHESFKQSIMQEVTGGGVEQKSKQYYRYREYGVWGVAGLSIVLGVVAMALIFAAVDDLPRTLRALHVSRTGGLVFIPYVWVVSLIAFLALGYAQIRETKRGYRYPLWLISLVLIAASTFGGAIVYTTGIADDTDHFLAEHVPVYRKYGNPQHAAWRSPSDGLLAGRVLSVSTSTCGIVDINGDTWKIDISMVTGTVVAPNMHIRVIGEKTGDAQFKAVKMHTAMVRPRPVAPPVERMLESMRTR